jgi:hypothetical protein
LFLPSANASGVESGTTNSLGGARQTTIRGWGRGRTRKRRRRGTIVGRLDEWFDL